MTWQAILFVSGALLHVGFLHWYARSAYPGSGPPHFLGGALMVSGVAAAGGLSVWFFLASFARQVLEEVRPRPSGLVVRGALYGVSATFVATEVVFVFMASLAAVQSARASGGHPFSDTLLSLVEIQTYGMDVNLRGLLFGLAYGGVAGATLYALRRGRPPLPVLVPRKVRLARASVAAAILGLICVPFVVPGGLCSVVAIVFGVRALLRRGNSEAPRPTRAAYVGVAGGVVGLLVTLLWTISSVLQFAPRR